MLLYCVIICVGVFADIQVSGKSRRIRDRDLERQVAAGNFDALAGQAEVVYQPDTSNWNPHRNGAQEQKKEIRIASVSYNASSGQSETTFKPSKVQKRKHQIHSLAYAAAERELELMDRKGQALKTKAQTHAKYGW
jgi:hypothetical protein